MRRFCGAFCRGGFGAVLLALFCVSVFFAPINANPKSSPKSSAPKTTTQKKQTAKPTQSVESKDSKSTKKSQAKDLEKSKNAKDSKDSKNAKESKESKNAQSQANKNKLPYSKKELKWLDNFLESLPKYATKQLQDLQKEREIFALANDTNTTKESKIKALKSHCQKGSALACSSDLIAQENPNDFQKAQKILQKECDAKPPNAKSGLYCARLADKYLLGKSKLNAFEKSCELGEALGCIGTLSGKISSKKRKKYILIAHAISENLCEEGQGIYCGVVASVLNFKRVNGAEYYAKKGCEELHDRLTCLILERLESKPKSMQK